ncbi:hypothetical protein [Trinickia acidisoli]|uniref:hypothetical protein n=1 Tax=Trinickia acidisoli TaxID=2767482 RepID=UPI001A8F07CE|nr:hypothetical protein [Trinickia acidisoli]
MSDLFFLNELSEFAVLASDMRLAHPFVIEPIEGKEAVLRSLRAAAEALGSELEASARFQGDSAAAVAWTSGPAERKIEGVTLALLDEQGKLAEVRIALRPVQFLDEWRERLLPWLSSQPRTWQVAPPDARPADSAELVHRRFPFPLADEAAFHAPAFVRPVRGVDAVTHVLAHAGAAYGECEYGPALRSDMQFLRAFTSKALPLEIVSIARLDADERIADWRAYMQPWPSMIVFRDRMRARLGDYLDPSYFE